MRIVRGKYAEAKVFADIVDVLALEQIARLCDQPFAKGSKIRVMPDAHPGAGCTIGTTMTVRDRIVPNLVGVDIGCGMETVRLAERDVDLRALDRFIRLAIPSGFRVRESPHVYTEELDLQALRARDRVTMDRALRSVGTLGGGNHFIELDRDAEGSLYLVVHSGSRHLGLEIAHAYQEAAAERVRARGETDIPRDLAYADGPLFDDYVHDMRIAQEFARLNRRALVDAITGGLALTVLDRFTTAHNYLDTEAMILRKGAVSAKKGERILVPINMRDGSLVCEGKGNRDWNCSAPHGAGRLFSRKEAIRRFTLDEYRHSMEAVWSSSVNRGTIDECPMAYKPVSAIEDAIAETATVVARLTPVYNFKAAGD